MMNLNEKEITIIGSISSFLSLIVGLVVLKNWLLMGIILVSISALIFFILFIVYTKQGSQRFQKISCEDFYKKLNYKEISSIDILGHTGVEIVGPLLYQFEQDEKVKNELKQVYIRVLLRSPNAEIASRAARINQTVARIRDWQRRGFNKLYLQFYENLPAFRSIICSPKHNENKDRPAYLSFYYFPSPNIPSKKYPYALVGKENKHISHHFIEVDYSWFEYFWGKNKYGEQKIHTLILDFDDTIVNSHDIQMAAWRELIEEAQNKYNLKAADFHKNIRDILNNETKLKSEIKKIFFREQDANLIFPEIFSSRLKPNLKDTLHQRRFALREKNMRQGIQQVRLFPNCKETLVDLSTKYNLIIVSATDEDMIIDYLTKQRVKANEERNLYEFFRYVFGKKEPAFDWRNMKRKSQLIIKIINLLGIPIERMVYVGDNNGDFAASTDIGIQFVEARLLENELKESIGKETLIFDDGSKKEWLYFTDWSQFPDILEKIEGMKT